MNPSKFDQANVVFTAPDNMEDCDSLPVHHTVVDGLICNISCWEASQEEITEIVNTRRVWLFCYSSGQPPVAVSGTNPFEESSESRETKQEELTIEQLKRKVAEAEFIKKRFCDIVPNLVSKSWEDIWERVRDKFNEQPSTNR